MPTVFSAVTQFHTKMVITIIMKPKERVVRRIKRGRISSASEKNLTNSKSSVFISAFNTVRKIRLKNRPRNVRISKNECLHHKSGLNDEVSPPGISLLPALISEIDPTPWVWRDIYIFCVKRILSASNRDYLAREIPMPFNKCRCHHHRNRRRLFFQSNFDSAPGIVQHAPEVPQWLYGVRLRIVRWVHGFWD